MFGRIKGLQDHLTKLILKMPMKGHIHEARISNKDVHKAFMQECKVAEIPVTEWPWTARHLGARSIDVFVKQVLQRNPERAARVRHGEVAASKMFTGTGEEALLLAFAPYDCAEMDAHRLDVIGTVGIPTPNGIAWVPIHRLQLLLIVDGRSAAILGYYVVVRREPKSEDILWAALPLVKPWKPRVLQVEGMTYEEGSGLPFGIIEGLEASGICALMVDNALINLGWAVVHRLTDRFGCAVNFGPVRKWMRRPLVERINKSLEQSGFQRLVATTGSGPQDPRRDHPEQKAVQHQVQIEELVDLIDVQIARYNGQGSEGRFGLSPLQVIEQCVAGNACQTLLPVLPPTDPLHPDLDVMMITATIRGNHAKGVRPSIKYLRGKYTNAVISRSMDLIGQKVVLHVREKDIRTVDVFLLETADALGTARVMGHWSRTPHSLELRKQVNRYIDDGRLKVPDGVDPVVAYHRHLAAQALKRKGRKRASVSPDATVLARESIVTARPVKGTTAHRPVALRIVGSRHAPPFRRHI
jgi:hypothetical protein